MTQEEFEEFARRQTSPMRMLSKDEVKKLLKMLSMFRVDTPEVFLKMNMRAVAGNAKPNCN